MENEENNKEIKKSGFANVIISLRTKRNLTQKQFAELIKVSDRTISKWENGLTVPDLINIRNICNALNVSPNAVVLEKKTFKDHLNNFFKIFKKILDYVIKNIFALGFIIAFILLAIFFINNYNTINIYNLRYDDTNDIRIKTGILINSKNQNVLFLNGISIRNQDYEIKSIDLKLYTYVNGDKFILYESDNLDSIYIAEVNHSDLLKRDIINEMKNNTYLDIKITDKKDKEYQYSTIIDFVKNFSNNKFIYSNTSYAYKNNVTPETFNKYSGVLDLNYDFKDSTTENNSENKYKDKLIALGYKYDADKDEYYIDNGSLKVELKYSDKTLKYNKYEKDLKYTLVYKIIKNKIEYKVTTTNKEYISYLIYDTINNDIECAIGNCENYMADINYILSIYEKIQWTL